MAMLYPRRKTRSDRSRRTDAGALKKLPGAPSSAAFEFQPFIIPEYCARKKPPSLWLDMSARSEAWRPLQA
jgi:hypothetical protein